MPRGSRRGAGSQPGVRLGAAGFCLPGTGACVPTERAAAGGTGRRPRASGGGQAAPETRHRMRRRVSCELCPGARRASHRRAARGGASGSLSLCVSGFPRAASTPWRREMSDLRRASVASAPSWPGLSRALFWADERHRVTPGLFWGAAHPPCGTAGCAGDDARARPWGPQGGRAGAQRVAGAGRAGGASRRQRGLGAGGRCPCPACLWRDRAWAGGSVALRAVWHRRARKTASVGQGESGAAQN